MRPFSIGYNHSAVAVRDIQRSIEFYEGILNLRSIHVPSGNPLVRWYALGNGHALHVIQSDDIEERQIQIHHLAMHTTDFAAARNYLREKGVPVYNWKGEPDQITVRKDGVRQLYFQDPDGNWLEINDDVL